MAYLGENHPAFLETLLACGLLGAIFVPLNTRLAPPEIRFQLQDCDAVALVHARSLTVLARAGATDTNVRQLITVNDPAPHTSEADEVADKLVIEELDELVSSGSSQFLTEAVGLDDGAMILYSSGTAGRPQGALLTHGNLTWNCTNAIVDFDFSSRDVALMISPMFHVAFLGMGVLPTLLKGGTIILKSRFDPGRALALIEQYSVTTMSGVPTTYQLICEHPAWATTDLSSPNKLTCGGSALPLRVLEAYESRGLQIGNGYGMTETAPGATTLPAARSRDKAGSCGLQHFFTDVRIADPAGEPVQQGTVGEIQIKGPNVIHEYWNRPDATAKSYAPGNWF